MCKFRVNSFLGTRIQVNIRENCKNFAVFHVKLFTTNRCIMLSGFQAIQCREKYRTNEMDHQDVLQPRKGQEKSLRHDAKADYLEKKNSGSKTVNHLSQFKAGCSWLYTRCLRSTYPASIVSYIHFTEVDDSL